MTQARVSGFTQPLPISMVPKLESVPGVARVAFSQWFGGIWQGKHVRYSCLQSGPLRYQDVYPECVMPDAQWQAFANTRTSMIVGKIDRRPVRLENRPENPDLLEYLSAEKRQQVLGL